MAHGHPVPEWLLGPLRIFSKNLSSKQETSKNIETQRESSNFSEPQIGHYSGVYPLLHRGTSWVHFRVHLARHPQCNSRIKRELTRVNLGAELL